ncbi:L,D-transpeptidase [Undibacter mobilis]|uniref:L,D-transpeptidase n=1 Tax=Undibacter mobilis TaxID=2292256 RepID=A0A371BBR7_9BRAD|nr:L,D-transpeptidase [Undibacter mobilis]RDV04853.1 L,D-transpeptidase [Undibacter mobilis]
MFTNIKTAGSLAALIAALALSGAAHAQSQVAFLAPPQMQAAPQQLSPDLQYDDQLGNEDAQLDPRLQRQIVDYATREAAGTVIVDTPNTYLYLVLGNGKALRYGIGVGREGFTWSGVKQVSRKAEWPDWHPPAEMIERQPYLPRFTAGGPGNPLGARAMYIGNTMYRIHGTNDPSTIGKNVSSGCIRLTNDDVIDLYDRVQTGAKVIVLPQTTEARARRDAPQTVSALSDEATSSYASAAPGPAERTWQTIRPRGIY